jgi:hypothetical protein
MTWTRVWINFFQDRDPHQNFMDFIFCHFFYIYKSEIEPIESNIIRKF